MFSPCKYLFLCVIPVLYYAKSCMSEPIFPPTLVLYSPGDPEYTDVLVKQEHDNLTLVCELRGDSSLRHYVWNHVSSNSTQRPYTVEPLTPTTSSNLSKTDLQLSDSGQYMCSAPPFSVTKYILVQTRGRSQCARGAFVCGARCVLAAYVCDGRRDCAGGEDEAPELCTDNICSRSDKLNCSSGRCISASACCRGATSLCRQPTCCDEFPLTRQLGFVDEYPPLFEDRHAPDDYGFIQSTIYTVTACALIFMIAVVLLVSAICKMHMKRAALRGYTHADRATRQHYTMQYAQAHRFPPCYEASRLLEENRTGSPQQSPIHTPTTQPEVQCGVESPTEARGLARLSSIFSSRYRQVPTQPEPVEMTSVTSASAASSPRRTRPLTDYRSPAFCDLDPGLVFADGDPGAGRDLNYTTLDPLRRTPRRDTLERALDRLDRQRLTLQLGRFQLSIPRFGRADPRPDTPTVAELNIEDIEFVRLAPSDTYTLNGRTIRLLGADFENYPLMPDGSVRPPSYTEAVRYKLYGPPPEYLSREGLNRRSDDRVDEDATANVEMPPCYEDVNADAGNNNGGNANNADASDNNADASNANNANASNANNADASDNNGSNANNADASDNNADASNANNADGSNANNADASNNNGNGNNDTAEDNRLNAATNAVTVDNNTNLCDTQNIDMCMGNIEIGSTNNNVIGFKGSNIEIDSIEINSPIETLSSIIDNLPAIDSDVNANETVTIVANDSATDGTVVNGNANVAVTNNNRSNVIC